MAEKFYFLCVRLFGRLYSSNGFCNKLFGSSAVAFVKGRTRKREREIDWAQWKEALGGLTSETNC